MAVLLEIRGKMREGGSGGSREGVRKDGWMREEGGKVIECEYIMI